MAKSGAVFWSDQQSRTDTAADREMTQIDRARKDLHAFADLYEAYVDLVWRYARSRLGNDEQAADATSATFHRAMRALPKFSPRISGDITTFRAWLMTIARNVVIDEANRRKHTIVAETIPDRHPGPEATAISQDEHRIVAAALQKLPVRQREIVECRLVGMKSSEIAEALGMSLSAVKTAHFRAYEKLRDLLREEEGMST